MYRVYDNREKKWIKDGVYLSPNDDLSEFRKVFLKGNKLNLLSDQRYTFQMGIGLSDRENTLIYEGDICKSTEGMIGLVVYAPERAAYVLLNFDESKYYSLGEKICKEILCVIGNVIDNPELINKEDEG